MPLKGRMLATPDDTTTFLAKNLLPAAKVDANRVNQLLNDLDNDDFATRETASRSLREFSHRIEPALRKALAKDSSAEARRRLKSLLAHLDPIVIPPAQLRAQRAIEVLEWLATPPARELLSNLAKGAPNALITRSSAKSVGRLQQKRR